MRQFLINTIFEMEKEKPIKNSETMRKKLQAKYKLTNEECSLLNRLITNYQVKKYDESLTGAFFTSKIRNVDENYYTYKRSVKRR